MNKDWWKWGDPAELKHFNDYPGMKTYLEERWNTHFKHELTPPTQFNIPVLSEKKTDEIKDIFASLTTKKISFKTEDRVKFALGKSYYDIIRICSGAAFTVPDVVITPHSHDEVDYILYQASLHNVHIIPFGGGTNVVGALSMDNLSQRSEIKCCLNLQHMDKLVHLDEQNMTATFQAGILGPKLEKILNAKGYTLGHFPQSFEYSSLGGWVVTRSAGQESTHYGKIEDIVEGLKVSTPVGTIHTPHFTHEAGGVNIMPLFVGSEGTLGVVTEVRVKIRRKPKTHRWVIALLPSFEAGASVMKELIQKDIRPSVVRLSDFTETSIFSKMSSKTPQNFWEQLKKDAQKMILKYKNLTEPNLMMMRFEEGLTPATSLALVAKDTIQAKGGMLVSNEIGEHWEEGRFKLPYLRDTLVEHGVFIDTYETIVPWDQVHKIHKNINQELKKCKAFHKDKGIFMTHISHIYGAGACLYFTAITRMNNGQEIEQWKEIKTLVMDVIMQHHGAVSHHHGVGLDHQKWYLKFSDPLSLEVLKSVKQKLDPKNILHPGKLFNA